MTRVRSGANVSLATGLEGRRVPFERIPVIDLGRFLDGGDKSGVARASGRERYSMPFFLDTNYEARVACLPNCRSAEHPAKYPPVIGGEYLFQRFDQTFPYRAEPMRDA